METYQEIIEWQACVHGMVVIEMEFLYTPISGNWPQVGLVQDGSSTYTPTTCSRWYGYGWLKADYKPDSSIDPSPLAVVRLTIQMVESQDALSD